MVEAAAETHALSYGVSVRETKEPSTCVCEGGRGMKGSVGFDGPFGNSSWGVGKGRGSRPPYQLSDTINHAGKGRAAEASSHTVDVELQLRRCKMLGRLSGRSLCTVSPQPWLFVGLGNPGDKFKGTRRNVGFEMIDAFAESLGISMDTVHCNAIFGKGFVDGVPVFLAKPQTYMNLSGESSGPLTAYYKLPLVRVIVFHDDMGLPCGVLQLHPNGGHGSHNGLKSVIHHFRGNREFARLRIGIGRPPGQMDPKAFLLQKFNATAQGRIDVALQEGVGALKGLLAKGLTESARCFNTVQKYKHIRLQTMPT